VEAWRTAFHARHASQAVELSRLVSRAFIGSGVECAVELGDMAALALPGRSLVRSQPAEWLPRLDSNQE
jgi:hypothetical protein